MWILECFIIVKMFCVFKSIYFGFSILYFYISNYLCVDFKRNVWNALRLFAHLWTGQVSEVAEPVDSGPAVIEGVDEFVGHHTVHVSLLMDVVLAQDDLQREKPHTDSVQMNITVSFSSWSGFRDSPERWQHQTRRWPSRHSPRRRNVCLYKLYWEEIK